MSGHEIAMNVDPNESDDVCTFCRHGTVSIDHGATCAKGHATYFRSLSSMGPIYVSNCGEGKLRPELMDIDTAKGRNSASAQN
jgi:hypothetical protein